MTGRCLTQEQADEYALGVLEPDVESEIAAHLRDCDACLAMVESSKRLAAALALAVPLVRTPPHLRRRVLFSTGIFTPGRLGRALRFAPAAAGLAAVFVAIAAFTGMVSVRGQIEELRDQNSTLKSQMESVRTQEVELLALTHRLNETERRADALQQAANGDRELLVAMMSPQNDVAAVISREPNSPAIGALVWDEEQKKVWFVASRLRILSTNETYQLWVNSDGNFYSLGTFSSDGSGFARYQTVVPQGLRSYEYAVVTIERAGGSERRSGDSVFVADLLGLRR
jgi:anti-sigma-K factor RskA